MATERARGTERSRGTSNGQSGNGRADSSARTNRSTKPSPAMLARRASAELAELLGRTPEGVISLERTEDGWLVGVEVVETRRIPETSDLMAEYQVEADSRGRLVGYHRARRYARGAQDV